MENTSNDFIIGKVKEWITPALLAIVGTMLWAELNELKQDVKLLLINSNVDRVRISILEKSVERYANYEQLQKNNEYSERRIAKKEDSPEVPTAE